VSNAFVSPATAFKQLREKAADLGIRQSKATRKQDEANSGTLRTLGLEGDAVNSVQARIGGMQGSSGLPLHSSQPGVPPAHPHHYHPSSHSQHDYDSDGDTSTNMGDSSSAAEDIIDGVVVCVHTVRLKGLHSAAMLGSANPYVAFSLGAQRVKTSVQWGRKDGWEWVEPQTASLKLRVSHSRLQHLRFQVTVFDKERIRRKRPLGTVSVSLAGLEVGSGISNWFALELSAEGGGAIGAQAEVFIGLRISDGGNAQASSGGPAKALLRSWSSNFRLKA
jgi:hypothetical protein